MKYKWMLIPAEGFSGKSEKEIVKEIGNGLITQQGMNKFEDDAIARSYAEDALKDGYISVRREKHTEYYKKKIR